MWSGSNMSVATVEDLFLEGCARMIVNVYNEFKYTLATCDECRRMVGGQTSHRCYYLNRRTYAEEKMTAALVSLQGKQWELFGKMREVAKEKHPQYDHLKAVEILEFFERYDYRLHPLKQVAVRSDWKRKVLEAALKMENFKDIYIGGNQDDAEYFSQEEQEEKFTLGTPPMRFSNELTQDIDYQ